MVSSHFQNCTLFIFTGDKKVDNNQFLSFNTDGVFFSSLLLGNPLKNRTSLTTSANNTTMLAHKMDLHQHRDKCTAAFIFKTKFSSHSAMKTYEIFKDLESYIKKDEDYFVFITNPQSIHEVLLNENISSGIKYKLCIPSIPQQNIAYSTCVYCDSGISNVLRITLARKTLQHIYPDFLNDFHGKALRVSTSMSTRWLTEIRHMNGTWKGYRGVFNTVLQTLMTRFNFTCHFFPSTGGGTGSQLKNGTWTGAVGDVASNVADLGHVVGHTWARNKVVGYIFPINYLWLTFTIAKPVPHYSWRAVYWPLGNYVWLGIIGSCIATFFLLLLTLKVKSKKSGAREVAEYIFRTLVDQSRSFPKKNSRLNGNNCSLSFLGPN